MTHKLAFLILDSIKQKSPLQMLTNNGFQLFQIANGLDYCIQKNLVELRNESFIITAQGEQSWAVFKGKHASSKDARKPFVGGKPEVRTPHKDKFDIYIKGKR